MLFLKQRERIAFVYFYWSHKDNNIIDDLNMPIILSIASLRELDDSPIYVIDLTNRTNWYNYEKLLGFKVIRRNCLLCNHIISDITNKNIPYFHSKVPMVSEFSEEIEEQNIICLDVDIMWLKKPKLSDFDENYVNCQRGNSGIFYFNKKCRNAKEFINKWAFYSMMGMINVKIRNEILKSYSWNVFNEEAVLNFLTKHEKLEYMDFGLRLNGMLNHVFKKPELMYKIKNIHFGMNWIPTKNKTRTEIIMAIGEFQNIAKYFPNIQIPQKYNLIDYLRMGGKI